MKIIVTISLLFVFLFSSACKRTYTCKCTDPGHTLESFKIKDTKKKAQSKCVEYGKKYEDKNIPFNETGCSLVIPQ
jgi:hypothetical protein